MIPLLFIKYKKDGSEEKGSDKIVLIHGPPCLPDLPIPSTVAVLLLIFPTDLRE